MKKFILVFAATAIYTSISLNSNAQKITPDLAFNTKDVMDLVAAVDAPHSEDNNSSILKEINPKAIKDFKKTFAARNKTWYKSGNSSIATFSLVEIKNLVAYDNKGKWQYTIRSYNEDKLAHNIRSIVKPVYYDYVITLVEEVRTAGGIAYLVHMQDETTWKIVKISADGEMELFENLNKG
jgi:hypothetical protein